MLKTFCTVACVMGLALSRASGAEPDFLQQELNLPPGEWFLRLEDWSYNEQSTRYELHSSGEARKLRGGPAARGPWQAVYSGKATPAELVEVYQSAEKLFSQFGLLNLTRRDSGLDDDGATELTVATSQGSYQLWFRSGEEFRDGELKHVRERLEKALQKVIPAGGSTIEKAGDAALRPGARRRFTVVVHATSIDPREADSRRRYRILFYEAAADKHRTLLDRELMGADASHAEAMTAAVLKKFAVPQLNDQGQVAPSTRPASATAIAVRLDANNRRVDRWFGREQAESLGVQKEVDRLVKVLNERLESTGQGTRLPPSE
jgi:hypothetical protein